MEKHYICTGGCEGVSTTPGTCQADTCSKHEMELKECTCADHKHWGAFSSKIASPNHDLSVRGLAAASAIVFGVFVFLNGFVAFLYDASSETLGVASIIVDTVIGVVIGTIVGWAIAWLYNKFKK